MLCKPRPRRERKPTQLRVRALAAYKDFLTLWKDADSDIPVLAAAKSEYAKLQESPQRQRIGD